MNFPQLTFSPSRYLPRALVSSSVFVSSVIWFSIRVARSSRAINHASVAVSRWPRRFSIASRRESIASNRRSVVLNLSLRKARSSAISIDDMPLSSLALRQVCEPQPWLLGPGPPSLLNPYVPMPTGVGCFVAASNAAIGYAVDSSRCWPLYTMATLLQMANHLTVKAISLL